MGVAAGRFLGEYDGAVHRDLEHATGGLHQAYFRLGIGCLQLGGQTGRPGLIVSDDAEFDRYAHGSPIMEVTFRRANRSAPVVLCQVFVLPQAYAPEHLSLAPFRRTPGLNSIEPSRSQ